MSQGQIDIAARGTDGQPGLFWQIKQRDRAAVGAWLDNGGDIEAPGYHGATPVLAAAIVDNWPMVLYLIERGARMNVTDARGFTRAYRSATTRVAPGGALGPPLNAVRAHLADVIAAYHFARRLKTLNGLTPYEYICKAWTSEADRVIDKPIHQMSGLNT